MKEIEVEIPLYRAKLLNGEYMIGLLMGIDKEDNLCSIREIDSETVGGHIGYLDTLSISISDMIDSNGKRIFASLNKSGRGGDMDTSRENFEGDITFIYESQETIPYFSSWDSYTVTEIKEF